MNFVLVQVELTPANSSRCMFKILPHYKLRSDGDEVCYNEQVKFKSVETEDPFEETEDQFLHCSARRYEGIFSVLKDWYVSTPTPPVSLLYYTLVYSNSYELNLSAYGSTFIIMYLYRRLPSHNPKALRVHTRSAYLMLAACLLLLVLAGRRCGEIVSP